MLNVPAGNHVVEFKYKGTAIQWIGWGMTGLAIMAVALFLRWYPRLETGYAAVETWIIKQVWNPDE
jgi:hypothetical protein